MYLPIVITLQHVDTISADKGKSVPMKRNVAYELHHPQAPKNLH